MGRRVCHRRVVHEHPPLRPTHRARCSPGGSGLCRPRRRSRSAALVDQRRRSQGRIGAEGQHAGQGPHLEGLRGGRRRRRRGDDGAEDRASSRATRRRRPRSRARRSRSGRAKACSPTWTTSAKAEKWDELLPKVVVRRHEVQGQLHRRAGQRAPRQLAVGQPRGAFKKAGAKVPTTWDEFFVAAEALKKAGVIAGRPRRPELAGLHHLRERWRSASAARTSTRRRWSSSTRPALTSPTMEKVLEHLQAHQGLHRQERPGPRLEPGHRDGHQGRSRHAAHGRLGQGRVRRRRQGAGQGLRLRRRAGHAPTPTPSTSTASRCSS